jgi:ribonucleoside-diphosphate reductase alpha chain
MKKSLENKIYTFEEAFEESKKYFKGDELAAKAFVNKYALKDSKENIYETNPDQMHKRLSQEISRIEKKYPNPLSEKKVYELIKDFKYIVPQGGPMAGIGNDYQIVSLSNCFVIGDKNPADSYGGIMKIDQEQVQLMKRRGGVGHDLGHIRPKKSEVMNSALTSTGVVPFMERYSNSTREVAQDGRRGALMLTIPIKHPDAEDFIDAKMEKEKITGANISIKIDDEFMKSVENGKKYLQQFPIDSKNPKIKKEIDAKRLWEKIIHNAWKSAEPGILFWDTIINESIPDSYADKGYKTVSTNPCGEIPLCPYDSCRLLALNLHSYVEKPFTPEAEFNFNLFKEHVEYAQRIMDDIIDLELEKIDKILEKIENDPESDEIKSVEKNLWKNIKYKAKEGRRTGVGVTGEGDMLAAINLKYGSKKGIDFSEKVHKTLALSAYKSSVNLAKERGAFEIYDWRKEEKNPFIKRMKENDPELYEDMKKHGRRNIALLTIAPTGTTSLMTQTTSGIEPVFKPFYKRRRKVNPNDKKVNIDFVDEVGDSWEEYNVFHHKFIDWLKIKGYDIDKIKKFSDEKLEEVVKKSPYYQATSEDVNWVNKVKMQGKIQKWVDHSISVTVNLPEDVTKETVSDVYLNAWKAGCKGVTVYREGSRSGVLLSGKEKKKNLEEKVGGMRKKREKELDAEVMRFKNINEKGDEEDWIAFVGLKDNKPYEIFTGKMDDDVLAVPKSIKEGKIVKEKNGGTHYDFHFKTSHGYDAVVPGISHQFKKEYWNYARLLSHILQLGGEIVDVVKTVSKLEDTEGINSWKAGVERALKKYIPNGTQANGEECPVCHAKNLVYQEGCLICKSCGSSKCG